ncbi:TRAP transporter substrate-binding protein [Arenibaculum pallidiluteum]|uniref:TRAP transporter substrate-binding protein n=1 Tax=Arenibaculum pallidiluteum TaxID=2812559 RepID=UPI001A964E0D|nr:TRAP transporter substrate-binding protein [Arenibaculum pallidiluteum]
MLTRRSALGACASAFALLALLGSPAESREIRGRLGHVFAIGSPVDQASKDFAKLLKERTNGELDISVFPNSQLGGDETLGRELARGSIEFAFLNPGSLTGLDPLLDIHYLPYIVTDFAEADRVFYNEGGILQKTLRETLKKHRMEPLAFFELEFRSVTNSKQPVNTLADLKGLKLRVPGSIGIKGFFDAAGAQAIAMPFPELFTGLQQGAVDGQDNGPSITYNSRLFEAQKHMTLTNHVYAMGSVVASERFWSRLSEDQRKTVNDVAQEVTKNQIARNRELNRDYVEKIRSGGVQVVEPSDAAMKEFREFGRAQWDSLGKTYGAERVQALRAEVSALERK